MHQESNLVHKFSALEISGRRFTGRIACRRAVRLETSDGRHIFGICTDVNAAGIGFETDKVLAVGQRLELFEDDRIRVPMMVIYRMGNHYGLSALELGDRLMELLPVQ